ncbi:MAG TPA: HTTM domain-containing protein [Polyangiaceae bacterium]
MSKVGWFESLVRLFDEREKPTALALIRILVAVTVVYDLIVVGALDLPVWLWAPIDQGGVSPTATRDSAAWFYKVFEPSADSAMGLYVALLVSAVSFGVGFFTRTSALVYVLLSAQSSLLNDVGDRGIDRAIRIVVLILAFSAAGRAYSIDARIATKSFRGDGKEVMAWPRYLVLGQLVVMYMAAGLSKSATLWLPWGGHGALYVILNEPIYAVRDFGFLAHPVLYFFTQIGTAASRTWELLSPVVLLAAYYRRNPHGESGWLRRFMTRWPVRDIYVAFGVAFHLLLAATLKLGIFPYSMLAFFPAFFRPDEIETFFGRGRAWLRAKFGRATPA